eukprot:g31092.t1
MLTTSNNLSRSVPSAKAAVDEEIQHCLEYASPAFNCLRKRVFENNNIRPDTMIMVYRAVMVLLVEWGNPTDTWESLAQDHSKWRRSSQEDIKHLETSHRENMEARRQQRKEGGDKEIHKGRTMDVVYMDFSKAFDKVPHVQVIQKVKSHAICGEL